MEKRVEREIGENERGRLIIRISTPHPVPGGLPRSGKLSQRRRLTCIFTIQTRNESANPLVDEGGVAGRGFP